MKKLLSICFVTFFGCLLIPTVGQTGKGYMGGAGNIVVDEPPADTGGSEGGLPDTVEGPLNDKMADSGKLFGDLYKILRYKGGEIKKVPSGDGSSAPQFLVDGPPAIGGEPILSEDFGLYAQEEIDPVTGAVSYEVAPSNFLSQCVQPVASFDKWGDIGRPGNTLPLIMTYDATWGRTECAVGEVNGEITANSDGTLDIPIDPYFIAPGGIWNGHTYCDGVLWTDLVEEVSFGRLNLSRSPEAVLQAAFDEAINAINAADSVSLDPAGRLLLTTTVYSETEMVEVPWDWNNDQIIDQCYVPATETVIKAIDSPLENLALYVKLMKDGHLITPGDERAPIDRSVSGGIPLWKMLELTDGPSTDLRPTLDIAKLSSFSTLVDATNIGAYYTYYQCYDSTGGYLDCTSTDPIPTSRVLVAALTCPDTKDDECIQWTGIPTADGSSPKGGDFPFAAAFLAAAGDKTGKFSPDMVVYLNSILGINKVVGYSAYEVDGAPADGAIDYSLNPVYFNYLGVSGYNRGTALGARGLAKYLNQTLSGIWEEDDIPVSAIPDAVSAISGKPLSNFSKLNLGENYLPDNNFATKDILGFTQMADDDLSVIDFIHTYQIPGLR